MLNKKLSKAKKCEIARDEDSIKLNFPICLLTLSGLYNLVNQLFDLLTPFSTPSFATRQMIYDYLLVLYHWNSFAVLFFIYLKHTKRNQKKKHFRQHKPYHFLRVRNYRGGLQFPSCELLLAQQLHLDLYSVGAFGDLHHFYLHICHGRRVHRFRINDHQWDPEAQWTVCSRHSYCAGKWSRRCRDSYRRL